MRCSKVLGVVSCPVVVPATVDSAKMLSKLHKINMFFVYNLNAQGVASG